MLTDPPAERFTSCSRALDAIPEMIGRCTRCEELHGAHESHVCRCSPSSTTNSAPRSPIASAKSRWRRARRSPRKAPTRTSSVRRGGSGRGSQGRRGDRIAAAGRRVRGDRPARHRYSHGLCRRRDADDARRDVLARVQARSRTACLGSPTPCARRCASGSSRRRFTAAALDGDTDGRAARQSRLAAGERRASSRRCKDDLPVKYFVRLELARPTPGTGPSLLLLLCQEIDFPVSGVGGWRRCQTWRVRWRLRQRMAWRWVLPAAVLRAM